MAVLWCAEKPLDIVPAEGLFLQTKDFP